MVGNSGHLGCLGSNLDYLLLLNTCSKFGVLALLVGVWTCFRALDNLLLAVQPEQKTGREPDFLCS